MIAGGGTVSSATLDGTYSPSYLALEFVKVGWPTASGQVPANVATPEHDRAGDGAPITRSGTTGREAGRVRSVDRPWRAELLTVVRFAVDGFIVNEDRNRWRGRRSDGLVGEVTVPGRAWPGVGRHSDGRRRA